jgi:hypothetical protein
MKKNIYLIYPPGYSGSYVSWCLSKSEASSKDTTVDNPINPSTNTKYGGAGTSHLHHRYPTHANITQVMYWQILHQPKEKQIYIINGMDDYWLAKSIHDIMSFDRDPVIIQISADDKYYASLGCINAVTKWPLYFAIVAANDYPEQFNLDFYNLDKDSLEDRNNFVHYYDTIFPFPKKLNFENSLCGDIFKELRYKYDHWYKIRSESNRHEINEEQFIPPMSMPNHFYNLDISEIYKPTLTSTLESIVNNCEAGDFNFEYVKSYHHQYIEAQQHLKFIEEINEFKKTKILTEYLDSHPLLQALVIREIFDELPADWETKILQEIISTL